MEVALFGVGFGKIGLDQAELQNTVHSYGPLFVTMRRVDICKLSKMLYFLENFIVTQKLFFANMFQFHLNQKCVMASIMYHLGSTHPVRGN